MLIFATSTPVTATRENIVETAITTETIQTARIDKKSEDDEYLRTNLARVLYIRYPITFWRKFVLALLGLGSEVNIIHPTFAQELGLLIRATDVGVWKIYDTILGKYGMVVAAFLVIYKANQVRFLEETFLMPYVSPKVVFGMLFIIINNVNVDFLDR